MNIVDTLGGRNKKFPVYKIIDFVFQCNFKKITVNTLNFHWMFIIKQYLYAPQYVRYHCK